MIEQAPLGLPGMPLDAGDAEHAACAAA